MRIEEALPYVAAALSLAAGWSIAGGASEGRQRLLKGLALASLAIFAFFRGVAPSTLSAALLLSALAAVLPPPRDRPAWASGSSIAAVLAWVAFGWLFWNDGLGQLALASPLRLAAAAVIAIGGLACVWGARRRMGPAGPAFAIDVSVLAAMSAAALTLPEALWPAMLGALLLATGEILGLVIARGEAPRSAAAGTAQWALVFIGQAAIAAAFLR